MTNNMHRVMCKFDIFALHLLFCAIINTDTSHYGILVEYAQIANVNNNFAKEELWRISLLCPQQFWRSLL